MNNITWSASNNSSFLNGSRNAQSVLAAVRAGRQYLNSELCGEGTITIYQDGVEIRADTKDIFTNFKWSTNTDL